MSRIFFSLIFSVLIQPYAFAQSTSHSVFQSPMANSYIDSSVKAGNFQIPAQSATLSSALSTPIKQPTSAHSPTPAHRLTKSLLGEQLNRINPGPAGHSCSKNAGCNCTSAVPANPVIHLPNIQVPLISNSASVGYNAPVVVYSAAQFPPPVAGNNLPAFRPFYGNSECYYPVRFGRIQRGLGWRWRR